MRVVGLFVGKVEDGGFNEAARQGFAALEARHSIEILSDLSFDTDVLIGAGIKAAASADLVIFVGGQGDQAAEAVASLGASTQFAVIQGSVCGPQLGSVCVMQEQSAFLAGVAAAHLTATGIVGHVSGHRVKPGLLGRAAFAAGVAHAGTGAKLLTGFCGSQDDEGIAQHWTTAEIKAGADIIFTMLNASRPGAIRAARAHRARLIGNVSDWTKIDPITFVASALARIDLAVLAAVASAEQGTLTTNIRVMGIELPAVVDLALVVDAPAKVKNAVSAAILALQAGRIRLPHSYEGPEFTA
jgi:basic membrane protein A and related proteins